MARILIADDSIIMRNKLAFILKNASHEIVFEASNGLQALRAYRNHLPDLVTMDISMPVLDGIETVKKIIEIAPQAKIIMISALSQREMVFNALKSGAKYYILKPLNPSKVLEAIDLVLNGKL